MQHPLNTILYGPPGTGKTYHTVNKAVAIANSAFDIEGSSRAALKDEYNRLVAAGQIQFVTFHQSMSYEDFIEGIKPVQPKPDDKYLKYEVQDGIFKRMVEQAAYTPAEQEASVYLTEDDFGKATFYSFTLATATQPGDKDIYRYCIEQDCIALNVAEGFDATGKSEADIKRDARSYPSGEGAALARLVHHLKAGNYVLLCDGDSTCRAIGQVTGSYQYKPNDEITPDHFRPVNWLVKDVQIPREQLYSSPFAYGLERLDRSDVKQDFFTKSTVPTKPTEERRNYVLIIDEINRGNVSQIFGELITLIEDDKRKGPGRDEALTVTLPYSKKLFSVPDNLYLIGTMNTADRSVEALDTALRRRFEFEAMMPEPELLQEVEEIDLVALLTRINQRLEVLLSKDHTIGHAWLMDVYSLTDLQAAFKNKILPLLQEYFYNNYEKIGLILGDVFFVKQEPVSARLFATFKTGQDTAGDYTEKIIYRFKNTSELTIQDFQSIYQ